jgi:hypothetical protein
MAAQMAAARDLFGNSVSWGGDKWGYVKSQGAAAKTDPRGAIRSLDA